MRQSLSPLLDLGELPFHIGAADFPSNQGFPNTLPFVCGVQGRTGLLMQMPNPSISRHLEKAYQQGSMIGTPMAHEGFGRRYADDFLSFILKRPQVRGLIGRHALEIGCGNGYFLNRLKEQGSDVMGIEPGVQGQEASRRYGIPILQELFEPHGTLSDRGFDFICHYGVLEHVEDPISFLKSQTPYLNEDGVLIFAVPDCREYIQKGDISMFLHEHWSYFSPPSLKALVEAVGLQFLHWEPAGYGGSLYVVAGKKGRSISAEPNSDGASLFVNRAHRVIENTREFFSRSMSVGRSLGLFCPARLLNLLAVIRPAKSPRFFDDDPQLLGKYYPPFDSAVESRKALLANPVDELFIVSRSFGLRLKAELSKEHALKKTRIRLPDDVFEKTDLAEEKVRP